MGDKKESVNKPVLILVLLMLLVVVYMQTQKETKTQDSVETILEQEPEEGIEEKVVEKVQNAEVIEEMQYDAQKDEMVKVGESIPAQEGVIDLWGGDTLEELFEPGGKPTVLYFTTTKCPYCDDQDIILKEYQEMGFEIRRLDKYIHQDIVKAIGVEGYPMMVFMDSKGVVPEVGGKDYEIEGKGTVRGYLGFRTYTELSEVIEKVK